MTREDVIEIIKSIDKAYRTFSKEEYKALEMAIQALEQEPCEDAISRSEVLDLIDSKDPNYEVRHFKEDVECLPSVSMEKTGRCKDCKYFEYDSVAKVDGIPLIVAHEICSKWGNGCKTREDGYCFLFEPQPYNGESGG